MKSQILGMLQHKGFIVASELDARCRVPLHDLNARCWIPLHDLMVSVEYHPMN